MVIHLAPKLRISTASAEAALDNGKITEEVVEMIRARLENNLTRHR